MQERISINNSLSQALVAAFVASEEPARGNAPRPAAPRRFPPAPPPACRCTLAAVCAEDADRQCGLRQDQFLLACDIHDLERGRGDQRRLGLLPKLRDGLAAVSAQLSELQQQQHGSSSRCRL